MRYQQDLQVSLRDRLRRLLVADGEDAGHEVRLVTGWIEQQPALRAILAEAEQVEPGLSPDDLGTALLEGEGGLGRGFRWPSQTEAGRATSIWHLMRRIATEDQDGTEGLRIVINYAHTVTSDTNMDNMWREFAERILQPFSTISVNESAPKAASSTFLSGTSAGSNGSSGTISTSAT